MAEGDLVDQLVTYALRANTRAWRIFWDAYGPLATHPHPDGRMALVADVPAGNLGRGGLHLASTPGGACWEVLLRDLQPRAGVITLHRDALLGRSLAQLRARHPVPLVDLRLPALRRLFADRDPESLARVYALWRLILTAPDHTQSHHAAAALAALATRQGLTFAGCSWLSAQDQGATVHLLYEPPYDPSGWAVVGAPIALSSAAGVAALRRAAHDVHMQLVLTGGAPLPWEGDEP